MNRNDVIDVLSVVAAATRRTVGETDVQIWEPIIGHIPKDLALQAVRDFLRNRPGVWLEPGHVVEGARAIKRDWLERPREDVEHYPGDSKAAQEPGRYPADWDSERRLAAYWYAVSLHSVPHSTSGWQAIDAQLKRKQAERQANS